MSQVFTEDEIIPVTLVSAGPVLITKIKSVDSKDGYAAICLRYGETRREIRALNQDDLVKSDFKVKQQITVDVFAPGDIVKVTGLSKGKGFQGVVKRHGFHGSLATHGHKDQLRMPGSIGATNPAHVFKGTRMAGRMGNDQVSLPDVEIIKIEPSANLLYLKGALPGARNGLVVIQAPGELKEVYVEPVAEASASETLSAEAESVAEALASEASEASETPDKKLEEPKETLYWDYLKNPSFSPPMKLFMYFMKLFVSYMSVDLGC